MPYWSRWYGPYKVIKHHTLGTYLLEDPNGNVHRRLINDNRLINARIPEGEIPTTMWSSPKFQAKLRKANVEPLSIEVQEILDKEDDIPPTYDELETISN